MAEKEDYFSFDEALDELRLKEEELKRLVSEGEIRAFRDGETMRLRRADVESLRTELSGGEVVDLGESSEELVFEDDLDFDDPGMATEEISEADTLLDDDVPDVGDIEMDDAPEPERATPTRRSPAAAAATEEEFEGMGLRIALVATSLVLVMALWVCLSFGGEPSDVAKSIAGIFGAKFD